MLLEYNSVFHINVCREQACSKQFVWVGVKDPYVICDLTLDIFIHSTFSIKSVGKLVISELKGIAKSTNTFKKSKKRKIWLLRSLCLVDEALKASTAAIFQIVQINILNIYVGMYVHT